MKIKSVIGQVLYKLIGKHMPISFSRFNFGARGFRRFCGRLIFDECGKNINIEKGAEFASTIKIGDNSNIGENAWLLSDGITIGNNDCYENQVPGFNRSGKFTYKTIKLNLQICRLSFCTKIYLCHNLKIPFWSECL